MDIAFGVPVIQLLSLVGAAAILAGFAGAQIKRLQTDSLAYLVLNTVGAAILAAVAVVERQWGFVLLEGIWTLVSAWSLIRWRPARMVSG